MSLTQEINFEGSTIEQLKELDESILQTRRDRMAIDPEDRYLSDQEIETRNNIEFFITKKTYQNDKVSIGDMFYTSWGYDQTNTEHYKVVSISPSGKTCKVREIGTRTVPGTEGIMCDQVKPDPDFEVKIKIYDEERHQYIEQKEHLPDLQVKIERSRSWNPITEQHEEIGEINLRGSVYYAGDSKHLQTLYRCKGSNYRSWYA